MLVLFSLLSVSSVAIHIFLKTTRAMHIIQTSIIRSSHFTVYADIGIYVALIVKAS